MPLLQKTPLILAHFNYSKEFQAGNVLPRGYSDYGSYSWELEVGNTTLPLRGMRAKVSYNRAAAFYSSNEFGLSDGDFTLDWIEYLTRAYSNSCSMELNFPYNNTSHVPSGMLFGHMAAINGARRIYMSSNGTSWDIASAVAIGGTTLNAWVHWAISRKNGTFYVFKDGALVTSFYSSLPIFSSPTVSDRLCFGVSSWQQYLCLSATYPNYVDEICLTDYCRYDGAFTPPTEEYYFESQKLTGLIPVALDLADLYFVKNGLLLPDGQLSSHSQHRHSGSELSLLQPVGIATPVYEATEVSPIQLGKNLLYEHHATEVSPILPATKTINELAGIRISAVEQGAKTRYLSSVELNPIILGVKSKQHPGINLDEVLRVKLIKTFEGLLVEPVESTSNAEYRFNLVVTPTHQYKDQIVNVYCEPLNNQPLSGKYQLCIGDQVIIPYGEADQDIHIDFEIVPDRLAFGSNFCRIDFVYADGIREYLEFEVFKEAPLRQTVERTFKDYDGGYIGSRMNSAPHSISAAPCFLIPAGQDSSIIFTTLTTSIPLKKYAGIAGMFFDAGGVRIYLSFDGKASWKTLVNGDWQNVAIEDIAEAGMSRHTINAITQAKWAEIYEQTQVDFAIYLNNHISEYCSKDMPQTLLTGSGKGTYDYSIPDGCGITSAQYQYGGNGGFYSYYNEVVTTIRAGATYGSIFSGTIDYDEYLAERPTRFTITGNDFGWKVYHNGNSYGRSQAGSTSVVLSTSILQAYLKSITVLLPPNQSPSVTNIQLAPDTVHTENTILTAHITDAEGDPAYYRVLVNGEPLSDYATDGTEFDIEVAIPNDLLIIGTSAIEIQTWDENTYSTPYTVYITKTNTLPTIYGVLDKMNFTATVNDADGDQVRYRILMNGVLVQDWSSYESQPLNLAYTMKKANIVIDHQNTLTLEVQDSLGETTSVDFDFVGQYYGLLFKDVDGALLSDDEGNVLKQLDFGVIIAGVNSEPQKIVVSNTTGDNLRDVVVTTDGELPDNPATPQPETVIQFDNTMDFTRPVSELPIASLNNNMESELWMRILTGRKSLSGGPVNLRAKGEVK